MFRGTDASYPVVIGMKTALNARRLYIARQGVWLELFAGPMWQPLRPLGFAEYAMTLFPEDPALAEVNAKLFLCVHCTRC